MKNYEDLTFADSYMFYRILRKNKDICIGLIERLLSIRVKDIKYLTAEADINFGYDSKGIRLDVYLEDEDCVFDLELQTYSEGDLPKRMRYYQSLIDIDHLDKGAKYSDLKESIILFICSRDYFGKNLPRYTIKSRCIENPEVNFDDKTTKVVYNFNRYEEEKDSKAKEILEFFASEKASSEFTRQIHDLVERAKKNEPWRQNYMTLQMMMDHEYEDGLKKGARETAEKNAFNALHENISPEIVARITGLSVERIQELAQSIKN